MNSNQKRLWVKELHKFNKKTDEEISVMLDIDLSEVKSYIAELNGGGVIMNTDKIKPGTSVGKKEDKPKKISKRDMVKKLYLDNNKNYEEISEELGLSISTIRLYVSQGGYNKNPRPKRKTKAPEIVVKEEQEEVEEKPYMDIGEGYVVYKGKLMKKMTKEEFIRAMLRDQEMRKNK